jgi:hypothetical protein
MLSNLRLSALGKLKPNLVTSLFEPMSKHVSMASTVPGGHCLHLAFFNGPWHCDGTARGCVRNWGSLKHCRTLFMPSVPSDSIPWLILSSHGLQSSFDSFLFIFNTYPLFILSSTYILIVGQYDTSARRLIFSSNLYIRY